MAGLGVMAGLGRAIYPASVREPKTRFAPRGERPVQRKGTLSYDDNSDERPNQGNRPRMEERVARLARQVEPLPNDDSTDEEWPIIAERAARRDLARDDEVEALFNRYRKHEAPTWAWGTCRSRRDFFV
jgi:hypothetical protein